MFQPLVYCDQIFAGLGIGPVVECRFSVLGEQPVMPKWFKVKELIAFLLILLAINSGTAQPAAAQGKADSLDTSVKRLVDSTFGRNPCPPDTRKSVGLWLFEEDKIPIGAAAARRLHQELLSRLLAVRPKCIDVLDSAGIGIIIDHLSKSGALEKNGGSILAALNETHQAVDLIVFPSLYNQGGRTVLALRAVERGTGKTLALTSPAVVPGKYLGQDVADDSISLDAAIKAASKYLVGNASELNEVRPLGIFFEDTSAQPAAGRYLMGQLIATITKDAANVLTGKTLKVRGLTIQPTTGSDGLVEAKELEPHKTDEAVYDLSGRYWIRGNGVDVRLSLKRGDAATLTWHGSIRLSEFKDLELRPSNPEAAKHPLPKGPFAFQVTTPKGAAPIYRPGEELTLFLRLGQEASIYCFYVDSQGGILTVLPNSFTESDPQANRFSPKLLHHLPEPSRDKFKLVFTPDTAGEEMVVCFATTRDVRADLPQALFPGEVKVVPFLTLDQLRKLFANLNDAKVSEASVTVTVAR